MTGAHATAADELPHYGRFAAYYDAIMDATGKDYGAEAVAIVGLAEEAGVPTGSLLDVACGTGRHLAAFRGRFDRVEGVDRSSEMLELARTRVPDTRLAQADFAALDLARSFDVVTCLFSSIGHVRDAEELDAVVGRLAAHVSRGGLLVVEPWLTPEILVPGGLRHAISATVGDHAVSRTSRSFVDDGDVVVDWIWTVATPDGVTAEPETLRMPVFTRQRYVDALARAGLDAAWRDHPTFRRGLVVGTRPADATDGVAAT